MDNIEKSKTQKVLSTIIWYGYFAISIQWYYFLFWFAYYESDPIGPILSIVGAVLLAITIALLVMSFIKKINEKIHAKTILNFFLLFIDIVSITLLYVFFTMLIHY